MKELLSHFKRVNAMTQLHGKKLEKAMVLAHRNRASSLVAGRNIVAGYARGWGLQFGNLVNVVQEDPLYQEALALIEDLRYLHGYSLMNLFLILKYGMKDLQGDIIDTGNDGFSALFIAYVARAFGFRGTVYSFDVFQATPNLEEVQKKWDLTNLIFLKGSFVDQAPRILDQSKPIILAHLDCSSYAPLKKTISILKPAMHSLAQIFHADRDEEAAKPDGTRGAMKSDDGCVSAHCPKKTLSSTQYPSSFPSSGVDQHEVSGLGGYLIFKDSLSPQSFAAFQAAEEFVEEEKVHAEQNFPHLVYRFPPLKIPRPIAS